MVRLCSLFVHVAGPNTALVKSSGRKDVHVVIGGRMFALPMFHRVDRLSLKMRTIGVHTKQGLTVNGVRVDVTSACQIKIHGWSSPDDASAGPSVKVTSGLVGAELHLDNAAVRLAAQHFIGKTDIQIEEAIKKTVSGHQRAIIGYLTVEELYRDREAFRHRVLDLISSDMRNMGLAVVSYVVSEISDSNGYIEALGVTRTETVKREAVEGRAEHVAAAKSRAAEEESAAHIVVNQEKQRKILSDKDCAIANAKALEVIERQKAIQQKAHGISSAEQDKILFVKEQAAEAAKTKAKLEVIRYEVEKEKLIKQKEIHVKADAGLYKALVDADAARARTIAEAERIRTLGEAQAEANRLKGLAEVEVLRQRNRAWQESYVLHLRPTIYFYFNHPAIFHFFFHLFQFSILFSIILTIFSLNTVIRVNSGAILEKIIAILPDVARSVAAPLSKTEKMVFINSTNDAAGATSGPRNNTGGAAAFTKDFKRTIAELPEIVNGITGVDFAGAVQSLASHNPSDVPYQQGAAGKALSNNMNGNTMRI